MTARKSAVRSADTAAGAKAGAAKAQARHRDGPAGKPDDGTRRYRFVVGATLAMLEEQVNRLTGEQRDLMLRQVLFATGTGFVAVLECQPERVPESG
ncbi:hypothetical protein [Paraburkholderia sp.]|uniref:hypothetical protein n=1 Tax=Paraburkholderia sp. TaxID=1926495 RepID=UPI0039E35C68